MSNQAASLLWLNLLGGAAVLASYAHGLASSATRAALWGGIPGSLRPLYTACMGLAAAGYFAFGFFVLFRLDPARTRVAGGLGFYAFHLCYALILIPSALWLPLTTRMLASPGDLLWLGIRGVLASVALGSIGLVIAVATARPASAPAARAAAIAGTLFFSFQTAVLDALVWPAYFPR